MQINGIDVAALTPDNLQAFPSEMKGKVLQLDADAVLYHATYEDNSLETCIRKFFDIVEYRRKMCGCEFVNLHLTGSSKGGRYKQATVKEYQGNRKGKEKPKMLAPLKEHLIRLTSEYKIILHVDQEADDGMAQANYDAIKAGTPELSVIHSLDKDLTMCSGFHADWNNFDVTLVDGFGSIYLDTSTTTTKIKGFGTSFFWAQLLTGDGADNIPGLPKLGRELLNIFDPTKKDAEDLEILDLHTPESTKFIAASKRLSKPKFKSCGPVLAYKLLKDINNDLDAMRRVIACYQSFYGKGTDYNLSTWDGRDVVTNSGKMLLEQAQLLWMRRELNECPKKFFKDVVEGLNWSKESILG